MHKLNALQERLWGPNKQALLEKDVYMRTNTNKGIKMVATKQHILLLSTSVTVAFKKDLPAFQLCLVIYLVAEILGKHTPNKTNKPEKTRVIELGKEKNGLSLTP